MPSCVFDIETNGLNEKLTKVHCIVIYDIETQEYHKYAPDDVPDGIAKLSEYEKLIGHNIISFDIPALDKVFKWSPRPEVQIEDTLIMSRLMYPDMKERDFNERRIMPNLYGRHSLESWGERLAFQKGKFGEGEQIFNNFSVDMLNYCARDVELNYKLYDLLCKRNFSSSSIELEHDIYRICEKQKENGFPFDSLKAARFYAILCEHRVLLHKQLKKKFGTWTVPDGPPFVPRVNNKRLGYVKGKEVQKLRTVEFNPNSRQHIAKRLKDIHGWKPKEFTPSGEAKIDETILESLPYPEAKMMADAFRTNKMIGQLSEGQNGWLHMEKQGKLHGTVHTMGTIASRCSHSHPNLGQVPNIHSPFGKECRQLFYAPDGYKLVGCDVSGLEARVVAHYLARYDNGLFGDTVLKGDIHTDNQKALGLPSRELAKTFLYAILYGAGVQRLGEIVGKGPAEGSKLRDRFFRKLPAFKRLKEDLNARVEELGYIKGLDGRWIPVRSAHSAINTLCQSAGAIICKRWVVEFHKLLKEAGLQEGTDYQQVAFVHDEIQVLAKEGYERQIGEKAVQAIGIARDVYDLRIELDAEYKIGNNWAETH
jgi:DNA polymerase III epsilon subunit-like protein